MFLAKDCVVQIFLVRGLPAIEMMICVIADCMTCIGNVLKFAAVLSDVVADTKKVATAL
jgi:hypothetical protein